jgi:hypothetical protein
VLEELGGDLGALSGDRISLRLLLYMIEETARHNGNVDLMREAIDGATGE